MAHANLAGAHACNVALRVCVSEGEGNRMKKVDVKTHFLSFIILINFY